MEFEDIEWDDDKARLNLRKHGVGFVEACEAFDDLNATETEDVMIYGEQRFLLVDASKTRLLAVIFTERGDKTRIISAREVSSNERKNYLRTPEA